MKKKIDGKLSNKSISIGSSIAIDIPTGMNENHFKILRERYISAGWKDVIFESNQRDGEWLSFKN